MMYRKHNEKQGAAPWLQGWRAQPPWGLRGLSTPNESRMQLHSSTAQCQFIRACCPIVGISLHRSYLVYGPLLACQKAVGVLESSIWREDVGTTVQRKLTAPKRLACRSPASRAWAPGWCGRLARHRWSGACHNSRRQQQQQPPGQCRWASDSAGSSIHARSRGSAP